MNELMDLLIDILRSAAQRDPQRFPLLAAWFGEEQPVPQAAQVAAATD